MQENKKNGVTQSAQDNNGEKKNSLREKNSLLVWIDLEMTGLDIEHDTILEIAMIITDSNLNIIARGPALAIHHTPEQLRGMSTWCQNQHTKSGLLRAVHASSTTLEQAQEQTVQFIKKYCEPRTAILSGNSVWVDRLFLAKYMPQVTAQLHYRMIDVSSVKELVARWYSENGYKEFKKSDAHRALGDIEESIKELAYYREHFFV
jgi:oligoribonuclease